MVDFWTNHFNVFASKGADRWLLPAYDRDTIRPNAMGKFSTLLQATAQSPAMLFYLDNFQSVSPNANQRRGGLLQQLRPQQQQQQQRQRRGINENYARELMELHTLGVDGGYTQKDVQEVARCFTGWTIFQPRGGAAAVNAMMGEARPSKCRHVLLQPARSRRRREDGPRSQDSRRRRNQRWADGARHPCASSVDGEVYRHQTRASFCLRHIHRRLSSIAWRRRFTKSDGDIRETLKAIFFSKEFNSTEAYRVKIKRPFELVISAIRTLGADTNGGPGNASVDRAHGRAALRISNAEWLFRRSGELGQHRRAARADELRSRVGKQSRPGNDESVSRRRMASRRR